MREEAVHRLVLEARDVLRSGGEIFLVARTRQGADSLLTFLREKFEEATIVKRSSGYKVLRAVKRRSSGESA